jgi:primosomal protein N' (replication factor Y)
VARVAVDVGLAHLDRPFDYLVPADLADRAVAGCRVRVRFAGRLVDGFVLSREVDSGHGGALAYVDRVVSAEPVLTPEVAALARAVADRQGGTLADVIRLAVPPRHARVESVPRPAADAGRAGAAAGPARSRAADAALEQAGPGPRVVPASGPTSAPGPVAVEPARLPAGEPLGPPAAATAAIPAATDATAAIPATAATAAIPATTVATDATAAIPVAWRAYTAGPAYLAALAAGEPVRAVLTALPGEDWARRLADAVAAVRAAGRGAVVVVPDARDLDQLDAAMTDTLGAGVHVALHAALGPAERYRRFLRASRGEVGVVIGTRAAAFAPVPALGLVAIWDDGDDLHAEPRAPYPHALRVLLIRAQLAGAGALVAATARSAEAQLLLETGWAQEVAAPRAVVRAHAPAVAPTGDDTDRSRDQAAVAARLPTVAWRAARDALAGGAPVLVQVPRRGYLPSVSCGDCHTPARCPRCAGPLELGAEHAVAACRWCGRPAADFACPRCGGRRLRAAVVGARRTAEELGRAFPGVPVRTSGRDAVLTTVPGEPALVVATPGAEPAAAGGYGAVLLLDTWALLGRGDLRAGEEALRRWLAAATLARPAGSGGRVVVVADGALRPVQALLRWDPATFAARELAERRELGFPPAARMASLTGPADAVADLLGLVELPAGAEVLGPVPVGDGGAGPGGPGDGGEAEERALVRVASRADGDALAAALHAAAAVRSARKAAGAVRVRIDPREFW